MDLSELLVNSGARYRKEILHMPVVALDKILRHMTLRPGIAGSETVGAVASKAEIRPYKEGKNATDTSSIIARTLTTYLGDVVEEFDPYKLFSTVYGEQFLNQLTQRTNAQIVRDLSLQMSLTCSKKLGKALFAAKRNDAGTTTMDLFNGFDTIAATEITNSKISAAIGNYKEVEAITEANAGDVLFSIYDAASEELQDASGLKLFMPKSVKNAYDKWSLANFGAAVYNTSYNKSILHGTDDNPVELVGTGCMKDSEYIYLTTKSNMLVGCDQASSRERVSIRIPDNPKAVQFFMCLYWGVEFQMIEPEYLMVAKVKTA